MISETMVADIGPDQRSPFGRLPIELRDQIYTYILSPGEIDMQAVHLRKMASPWIRLLWDLESGTQNPRGSSEKKVAKPNTGILRVCRQISDEALDILYRRNHFIVALHGVTEYQLFKLGPTNLRRIHSLQLIIQFQGGFPMDLNFDPTLWIPLLSDLNRLSLVLQQPLTARKHIGAPSLEADMRQWTSWLDPLLEYLAAHISKSIVIEIDCDERLDTTELLQKHLGSRLRNVQTPTGDRLFGRSTSAHDPGSWKKDEEAGFVMETPAPVTRPALISLD
ncbi:hypothetical protein HJFPF1_00131 [Paramyrothecium foliicola]|nr:hypothetical protein HJFPF1_00131 [Paramyrothecium foliicola]